MQLIIDKYKHIFRSPAHITMSHQGLLKSVPSLVEKPEIEASHKTTPLPRTVLEEEKKTFVDSRGSLTDENIELVNSKLEQIVAARERDDSDLRKMAGLNIKDAEDEPTDANSEEEIGKTLVKNIN